MIMSIGLFFWKIATLKRHQLETQLEVLNINKTTLCELLKHDYIQAKADAKTRQSETTNTLDAVAGKMA